MDRSKKPKAAPSTQSSTHPETQKQVKPGTADANSSKSGPTKQSDTRSPHDRDGNAEQSRTPRAPA